jgi:hypothetical protein
LRRGHYFCVKNKKGTYQDESGKIWKDVNLGNGKPYLHSADDFDGEPDMPITVEYEMIENK